jgi:hypothetical protein
VHGLNCWRLVVPFVAAKDRGSFVWFSGLQDCASAIRCFPTRYLRGHCELVAIPAIMPVIIVPGDMRRDRLGIAPSVTGFALTIGAIGVIGCALILLMPVSLISGLVVGFERRRAIVLDDTVLAHVFAIGARRGTWMAVPFAFQSYRRVFPFVVRRWVCAAPAAMRAHWLTSVSDLPSFSQNPIISEQFRGRQTEIFCHLARLCIVPRHGSDSSFWNQIRSLILFLGYSLHSYVVVPGPQGSHRRFDFAGSPYLTRTAK